MVGRLVEEQDIALAVDQLAQADLGLLAARQDADLALDVLGGQTALGQSGTDFKLGEAGELLPDLLDAGGGIVIAAFLLKVADLQAVAQTDRAGQGRDDAQNALEQGGLADTVGTDQSDLLAAFHAQIEGLGEGRIVADDQILGFKDHLAGGTADLEVELGLGLFGSQLDELHLVQLLLTGHGHVTGGNTGLVAVNKVLEFTDLLLLALVGSFDLSLLDGIDFLEAVVVADITGQLAVFHVIDQVDNFIDKGNVVGNEDEGIFVFLQVALEPCDMLFVQIVGGLVQQQDLGLFQQQLGQQDLGTLTAAQIGDVMVKTQRQQTQRTGNFLNTGIDHIEIVGIQHTLDLTQFIHEGIHLFGRSIAQLVADLVHAGLQIEEPAEGRAQNILNGHTGGKGSVLIEVAGADIARPFDLAFVGHQLAGDDIHKGRLAFAVGADQADVFTAQQAEGYVLENGAVAKAVGQVFDI